MGFLKKLAGVFGFGQEAVKNEEEDGGDDTVIDSGDGDKRRENNQPRFRETGLPRRGFGVPVQVAVERSQLGPVLQPCSAGDGGIQGLRWYTKRLRVDEDGDVADEFLEEGDQPTNGEDDHSSKTMPRLEAKRKTKPAKVRRLVVSSDGKLQQCIEHQGRLFLV
ncbi:Phospholipid hydroperoxide glutathione peroxidase [Hirschfeldia incana]|nr:Phospholipid hydroperoxide glutathione peroxidase [Hirschfeldia incana]